MELFAKYFQKCIVFFNSIRFLSNKNVIGGTGARFRGLVSISISSYGKLILANNVTIVGGLMINPLGRNIRSMIKIDGNAIIEIGNNVGMSNVSLWAKSRISIGNNVKIGADCLIFDSDMHSLDFVLRRDIKTDGVNAKSLPIVICDDVFVGARCIIMKGVTIGERAIIASGSVVSKSIPPDEIWGGNPASYIKSHTPIK